MRREPRHSANRGLIRLEDNSPVPVSAGSRLSGGGGGEQSRDKRDQQACSNQRVHALESVLLPTSFRVDARLSPAALESHVAREKRTDLQTGLFAPALNVGLVLRREHANMELNRNGAESPGSLRLNLGKSNSDRCVRTRMHGGVTMPLTAQNSRTGREPNMCCWWQRR